MKKLLLAAALSCALCCSCNTALQSPTSVDRGIPANHSEKTKASAEEIAKGREIHDEACYRCHDLYKPTEYSDEQWVKIMKSMGPKSHLGPEEYRLVLNYLQSAN